VADDDDDDEPAPKPKAKPKAKAKAAADDDDDDEEEEEEVPPPKAKKAKTEGDGKESNEVFVGGLPFATSEEQVKKDFEECGEIVKFTMPKNDEGRPKGIAFITFKTKEGVEAALKYDGDEYGGRTLKVNLSSEKPAKGKGKEKGKDKGKSKGKDKGKGKGSQNDELTVCIRGLSYSLDAETVEKDFAECGELVSCRCLKNEDGQLRGIAFVEFKDDEAVKKALEFNETEYSGRTIYVSKAGDREGKGKGKDGKGKDGKGKSKDGKGKGKDKGKGKGKKGKATSANKAAKDGTMVESTGTKQTFDDSDEEEEEERPAKKAKVAKKPVVEEDDDDDDE